MPTRLPPTTRTGTSIVCGKRQLLLDEQLAVVLIVLADEFVDLVQVGAKGESTADRPGPHKDVGIFERRFVLQRIERGTAEEVAEVAETMVAMGAPSCVMEMACSIRRAEISSGRWACASAKVTVCMSEVSLGGW